MWQPSPVVHSFECERTPANFPNAANVIFISRCKKQSAPNPLCVCALFYCRNYLLSSSHSPLCVALLPACFNPEKLKTTFYCYYELEYWRNAHLFNKSARREHWTWTAIGIRKCRFIISDPITLKIDSVACFSSSIQLFIDKRTYYFRIYQSCTNCSAVFRSDYLPSARFSHNETFQVRNYVDITYVTSFSQSFYWNWIFSREPMCTKLWIVFYWISALLPLLPSINNW